MPALLPLHQARGVTPTGQIQALPPRQQLHSKQAKPINASTQARAGADEETETQVVLGLPGTDSARAAAAPPSGPPAQPWVQLCRSLWQHRPGLAEGALGCSAALPLRYFVQPRTLCGCVHTAQHHPQGNHEPMNNPRVNRLHQARVPGIAGLTSGLLAFHQRDTAQGIWGGTPSLQSGCAGEATQPQRAHSHCRILPLTPTLSLAPSSMPGT